MGVMEKLKALVVQEPVVAASCLMAGVGLFLPAVVRPILNSMEASKQVPQPALRDVVAGMLVNIFCSSLAMIVLSLSGYTLDWDLSVIRDLISPIQEYGTGRKTELIPNIIPYDSNTIKELGVPEENN